MLTDLKATGPSYVRSGQQDEGICTYSILSKFPRPSAERCDAGGDAASQEDPATAGSISEEVIKDMLKAGMLVDNSAEEQEEEGLF